MQQHVEEIVTSLCPAGLYETGYADLRGLLPAKFREYCSGIIIARKMDNEVLDTIANGPTEEYFRLYRSVNSELTEKIKSISERLAKVPVRSLPVNPTIDENERDEEYLRTLRYRLSHKMVATRAGLGWIGKTDLFISRRFGPRIRLASILTDIQLQAHHKLADKSRCGRCNLCVEICPPGAATGKLWNTTVDRNAFFDPFKCRTWCRNISKEKLDREISLCGLCVMICPIGKNPAAV